MPDNERYGLISQLRRAAISIPSNIAKGAARSSKKESGRFYDIASSSLVEIDTQIELAVKLIYLSVHEIADIGEIANEVFAMLSKMIKDPF